MELVTLACNECGAPLRVDVGVRFLTCEHCGARLEVHRRDGGAWTKKIEKLEERIERLESAQRPRRRRPWRRRNRETGQEEYASARVALAELGVIVMVWIGTTDLLWLIVAIVIAVAILAVITLRNRAQDEARAARRRARQARRALAKEQSS